VRREIDRAINEDWQTSIHLNHAVEIAFVPFVTAPRFIGHVLDGETFVRRKRDVRQRPGAAFLDCELKHGIEFFLPNYKRLSPILVALPQRTASPVRQSDGLVLWRARTPSRNLCVQLGNDLI